MIIRRGSVFCGGGVDISNTVNIAPREPAAPPAEPEEEQPVQPSEPEAPPEPPEKSREELLDEREQELEKREEAASALEQELARLKEQYIEQGKQVIGEAKRRAESITAAAQENAAQITADAEQNRDSVFIKARAEGFEQGRTEGIDVCRREGQGILDEAKQYAQSIVEEKAELFAGYEKEIFDTIMAIANKVTLDSMAVKDGTAAKKLIKKAAKEFSGAQNIRITLDKNGATEQLAGDYEYLKELCGGAEHVEVELLPDAEPGTVIVDNGSEITDAGINTQLRMIQELGSGRFREPAKKKGSAQEKRGEVDGGTQSIS